MVTSSHRTVVPANSIGPRGQEKVRILAEILQNHPDWRRTEVEKQFHAKYPGVRVHAVDFAAARRMVGMSKHSRSGGYTPGGKLKPEPSVADLKKVRDALRDTPQLAQYISPVCELAEAVGGVACLQATLQELRDLGVL